MTGRAVVGPLTGKSLPWLPSEVTTWREWRAAHPETTVLKPPFPLRAYERKPYRRYRQSQKRMFPDAPTPLPETYRPKDDVTIVVADGKAKCYPHKALPEGETKDAGRRIVKKGKNVTVYDAEGREIPSMTAYWFAFCAFYPDGEVYEPPAKNE